MEKGLRTVLSLKLAVQSNPPMPQLAITTFHGSHFLIFSTRSSCYAACHRSHSIPTTSFQAQVPGEAISTSTPQASTSIIAVPSPQTSKSPGGKATVKSIGPARLKQSINANLEAAVASIPTSSMLVNTKGNMMRAREAEVGGTTLELASAPSPSLKVTSDWESPPNEEDKNAMSNLTVSRVKNKRWNILKVTKIDENPESDWIAIMTFIFARPRDA